MTARAAALAALVAATVGGCTSTSSTSPATKAPAGAETAFTIPTTIPTTIPPAADVQPATPATRIDGAPDASSIAAELDAAVNTLLDPAATSSATVAAGQRMQLLLRHMSSRPELDADVLGLLGPASRPSIGRIVAARQFGQARAAADPTPSEPPTTLPAWRIVGPQPVSVLRGFYDEAEAVTGVPWYWLAAINLQETRMGRIVGVSSAGATGPMQFLPSTWAECCTGDPTITRDAIIGAATYLVQSGAPADMAAAVHQYNPNDSYVATVTAYAESLRDQPQLYLGFHAWQVFTGTAAGTVRLPVGYAADEPVDAGAYLADHPDDAA